MADTKRSEIDENKIEWLGLDGLLVMLFPIMSFIIGYCLINNVDIIIGKIIPYIVTGSTTLIFLKYITQVIHFSKKVKEK